MSRKERDLEREIRNHLDLEAEKSGPRQAHRIFGNATLVKEDVRAAWGWTRLEQFGRDVRDGLHQIRRHPAFSAVAIATLALGIGANTAIFSVVNGVLLRPLNYPDPERLMYMTARGQIPVSVPEYLEFQQFNGSFAHVGAFRLGEANLMAGDRALRVRSAIVDAPLLNALGLLPAQGRLLTGEDSVASAPALPGGSAMTRPVALISYELWRSAFGERPIVGHNVDVDGRRFEVVGVMARGADLMDHHTKIWLPLGFADDERRARNNHNLFLIGRLKDGVTPPSAQTELKALIESWGARTGIVPAPNDVGHVGHVLQMTPLVDQILGRAGRSIWVLQAAVALVLLIACANVANLMLARAETRQREFAVLTALGAGRGRLLRRSSREHAPRGGRRHARRAARACGGRGAPPRLSRQPPATRRGDCRSRRDVRVVRSGHRLRAAVWPGAHDVHPCGRGRGNAQVGPRGSSVATRHYIRRALVVAETALAVIVVGGAGLLLRTVHNLTTVDAGFDRSRLVTFSITLPRASFNNVNRVRAYQRLLEQLRGVPGVDGASAMTSLPLDRQFIRNGTEITNNTASSAPSIAIDYQRVMSGFFETTGIPILQGRGFQSTDAASEGGVAVVNETMVKTYWEGRNPIGERLRPGGTTPWFTVVGVAKDVKQGGVDQPVGAETYLLIDQLATHSPTTWVAIPPTMVHVVARTTLPLAALAPTIARAVRDVDPAVPVSRLREMDDVFTESIRRPRLLAQLVGAFGGLALLLAAIGTYGVLSYSVTARRREIGIRMALGADRSRVFAQVMRHGLVPTSIGVAAGLAGALGLSRLISTLLFGVQSTDRVTMAVVVLTISVVAVVACWLPAWRASRLDPNVVLRNE